MSHRHHCASHKLTNTSISSDPSEISTPSSIFRCLPQINYLSISSTGELSCFNQSDARFAELDECSQSMSSEAFLPTN